MAKPNFFCGIEALQWLLENEPKSKKDDIDLTVDFIEAPYLFIYTSNAEAWNFRIMGRGELYDHEQGSGILKGNIRMDKETGQGSGTTSDQLLRDNLGVFFEACRRISRYIYDENLQPLYRGLDPEQAGVLLEVSGNKLKARKVEGMERPELMCSTLFGGNVMMRPYMEDFLDRSETEMMPLEDRIEKAEQGDKFAIAKLAQAYLDGDDEVEQDPAQAAYWFRKEAEMKDPEGAFNLGLLYAKGFGVERDFHQAAEWMEKAVAWGDDDGKGPAEQYRSMAENQKKAEAGDAKAMAELAEGFMGLAGSLDQAGPGKDYEECLRWAQKAVDAGCGQGYWPLALAYDHGRGVKKDAARATELYKKGAEMGSAPCQHSYGCRLINGEGVKKDAKAAFKMFEKSANQGYALACKALGHMYETGEGVEPDFDRELEYYEQACKADPSDAKFLRHVGFQYTNLLENRDTWLRGVERAAHWLRVAANQGERTAASGAEMYERILELHKQGVIPLGASISECMGFLSNNGTGNNTVEKTDKKTQTNLKKDNEKPKPASVTRENINEIFKQAIVDWMQPGKQYTASEIMNGVPDLIASGKPINIVSAYLTQLTDQGIVRRSTRDRKNYYQLSKTSAPGNAVSPISRRQSASNTDAGRETDKAFMKPAEVHSGKEDGKQQQEAERRRQEEERARKKAEEKRRQEEQLRREEAERRRQEEERARKEAEEEKRREEQRRMEEAERRRQEEERARKEKEEEKRRIEEEKSKVEEARRFEEERQRAEEARWQEELRKKDDQIKKLEGRAKTLTVFLVIAVLATGIMIGMNLPSLKIGLGSKLGSESTELQSGNEQIEPASDAESTPAEKNADTSPANTKQNADTEKKPAQSSVKTVETKDAVEYSVNPESAINAVYTGTGDDVIALGALTEPFVFEISGEINKSKGFEVTGYRSDNSRTRFFVDTWNGEKYHGFILDNSQETSYLEIECGGEWEVKVLPLSSMPMVKKGMAVNGSGDAVLLFDPTNGETNTIVAKGDGTTEEFEITGYKDDFKRTGWLVESYEPYEGRVLLKGSRILEIDAYGDWTITFE